MLQLAKIKCRSLALARHGGHICKRALAQTINLDDSGYEAVPHYKQNSALFIAQPDQSPFPNIVSPDTDFDRTFQPENMLKSSLNVNLTARYGQLNLVKLKEDYTRMRGMEERLETLAKAGKSTATRISNLIKEKGGMANKKKTLESPEAQEIINAISNFKQEMAKVEEELLPLKEIVTTACLRLPNSIHFSTLFIHSYQQGKLNKKESSLPPANDPFKYFHDSEDSSKLTLFDFNHESIKKYRKKVAFLPSETHWKKLVNDSIVIDSKLIRPRYAASLEENWSFVEQASDDLNNQYLVGSYAKLERALLDYTHDKIRSVGCLEHIKSASLFKSAIVEGCGQSFYDPTNTLNVVRFAHKSSPSKGGQDKPAKESNTSIELLHLTGSSSLQALVLNFVRTSISPKHLPWGVFTNGNTYTPKKGQRNTYDVLVQCADKSSLVLENDSPSSLLNEAYLDSILTSGKDYLNEIKSNLTGFVNAQQPSISDFMTDKSLDKIFIDLCKMFVYIYKDFGLPMRFVCLNANELKQAESFKVEVQAYLPSEQNYTTIGKIILLNDYVSKRLQIRLGEDGSTTSGRKSDDAGQKTSVNHTHMVYARLMNINSFMQVLIESNLVKRSSKESAGLPLLEKADTKDVYFVLPSVLKKYFMV